MNVSLETVTSYMNLQDYLSSLINVTNRKTRVFIIVKVHSMPYFIYDSSKGNTFGYLLVDKKQHWEFKYNCSNRKIIESRSF